MGYKLSAYRVATPVVWNAALERHEVVVFATRTAAARVIDAASWKMAEEGRFEALAGTVRDALIEDELLVDDREDELSVILSRNAAAIDESDTVYLVVQPTAMCQLGCDYCGQRHTADQLSELNQDLLVARTRRQIEDRPEARSLFVSWFGGEPLLGLRVMRRLSRLLQELADEFGLAYQAKLITNGLALGQDVSVELIRQMSIRQIEVTLDGDAENHDARRGKKAGQPTFDRIFANIAQLARRDDMPHELSIRCNVDRRNAHSVNALMALLVDAGLQDRVTFYLASVYSWGNDAHHISLSPAEFAEQEIHWFARQTRLGFRPSLLPDRKPIVCMAVEPDSLLVDAHGNLFNCTEVSYVPTYGTPNQYQLGHVSGAMMTPEIDLAGFNDRIAAGVLPCHSCRMLPVCGGSCPKKWAEGLDPCPSAKRNIEQRLLLSYALSLLPAETAIPSTKPEMVPA